MNRNTLGAIAFALLSLALGIIVYPFMIIREIYQYHKYLKPCGLPFETDDVIFYSFIIFIFSMFHWCWVDLSGLPVWMMF